MWKIVLKIARWEFKRKITSKAFIFSLILFPALLIASALIPFLHQNANRENTEAIGVLDRSGDYANALFAYSNSSVEKGIPDFLFVKIKTDYINANDFLSLLRSDKFDGLLVIDGNKPKVKFHFYAKTLTQSDRVSKIQLIIKKIALQNAIQASGSSFIILDSFFDEENFQTIHVSDSQIVSEDVFKQQFLMTLFPVAVFFIIISFSGGLLVRSMFEEKSNNLMDVLLSSCSIKEILAGKLIGLAGVNIVQLCVWILVTGITLFYSSSVVYPTEKLLEILVYIVFGLILYNAMYVSLGALINEEQSAQYVTSYFSLLAMIPGVFIFSPLYHGGTSILKICTYIPIFTPTAAIIRLQLGSISMLEMIGIIVFMILVSGISVFISVKLFRIKHRYSDT